MHFTVYLTVKLHMSFNCNLTSIYNSVGLHVLAGFFLDTNLEIGCKVEYKKKINKVKLKTPFLT